jgi:hypothetical protein
MPKASISPGTRKRLAPAPPRRNAPQAMRANKIVPRVSPTRRGDLNSLSLQKVAFVPQLVQEEPCKFSFVSSTLTEGSTLVALYSNRLGNWIFTPGIRVRISLALIKDLVTQWLEYAPFKRRVVGSNPTRVTIRLIAQRTEQLPSKERVLGSNPSKAENASESDGTMCPVMHMATAVHSIRSLLPSVGAMVAQIPYKDKVERSSRSRKTNWRSNRRPIGSPKEN